MLMCQVRQTERVKMPEKMKRRRVRINPATGQRYKYPYPIYYRCVLCSPVLIGLQSQQYENVACRSGRRHPQLRCNMNTESIVWFCMQLTHNSWMSWACLFFSIVLVTKFHKLPELFLQRKVP